MGQKFAKEGVRCGVSDPAQPHTLSHGDGENPPSGCFSCKMQSSSKKDFHYRCISCDVGFHDGCHQLLRHIQHPYHLQHPLTLTTFTSVQKEAAFKKITGPQAAILFEKCTWCGRGLNKTFYTCFICGFCLDLSCAKASPPLTITNPKSHHHPLFFFPRPLSVPCDACGLVSSLEPSYTCFQCNYIVHQSCIDLPRVIKITRHPHRLSYTPHLPPTISLCRICYKTVDLKHGKYSCSHEECSYLVHSKCGTHKNVWDGKELEWDSEEPKNIEDIESFKMVGKDLIKHIFHDHHLKLGKYEKVRDADKQCQACVFPIDSKHDFYKCIECDFCLHEVCANLPRTLEHALHHHPLVLQDSPLSEYTMDCSFCCRKFSGFLYKCPDSNCQNRKECLIDIRCILIPDLFTHKSHEHQLFISTIFESPEEALCRCCKMRCSKTYLQCTTCKFAMCYGCVTIPDEVYYKYDAHPLSLCYGEDVDDTYWCEVCEKILDPTEWFYTCNKCCVTIHRQCIYGSSVYMRYGYKFNYDSTSAQVVHNNRNSRPICCQCDTRCIDSIYYKFRQGVYCSIHCMSLTKSDKRMKHLFRFFNTPSVPN